MNSFDKKNIVLYEIRYRIYVLSMVTNIHPIRENDQKKNEGRFTSELHIGMSWNVIFTKLTNILEEPAGKLPCGSFVGEFILGYLKNYCNNNNKGKKCNIH